MMTQRQQRTDVEWWRERISFRVDDDNEDLLYENSLFLNSLHIAVLWSSLLQISFHLSVMEEKSSGLNNELLSSNSHAIDGLGALIEPLKVNVSRMLHNEKWKLFFSFEFCLRSVIQEIIKWNVCEVQFIACLLLKRVIKVITFNGYSNAVRRNVEKKMKIQKIWMNEKNGKL